MLSSWKGNGDGELILEIQRTTKVKYTLNDLKERVLEPAKEELYNNEKSDIWFEYKSDTSDELKTRRKRKKAP